MDGPTVEAYFKPLVAFAREHFLRGERHIHESLIAAATDKPRLRDGVNIVIEPRAVLGELRLVWVGPPYAPGRRWAETSYCLHVLRHGTSTTIAVEEFSSMIR